MFHLLPTVCSAFILILGPAKISNILLEHTFPNTVVLTLVSTLQKGQKLALFHALLIVHLKYVDVKNEKKIKSCIGNHKDFFFLKAVWQVNTSVFLRGAVCIY